MSILDGRACLDANVFGVQIDVMAAGALRKGVLEPSLAHPRDRLLERAVTAGEEALPVHTPRIVGIQSGEPRAACQRVPVPGDIPVPGIAHDAEAGPLAKLCRQFVVGRVGGEPWCRWVDFQLLPEHLLDEGAGGPGDVDEHELGRDEHPARPYSRTGRPALASVIASPCGRA